MSRPDYQRSASTNLRNASLPRPLDGKLAIITGGSRGIGAAIAHNLASKGCSLVLNYTSLSSTTRISSLTTTLQTTYNVRCIIVQADLSNPAGPAHIVETARNNFAHPKTGKFTIDIIVNNAGVAANSTVEEVQPEQFKGMYAVNVLAPLLLVQAALPYLPHDRSGRIVNISSVSSSLGFLGQSVYGGTKAALESMTRTWSRELAERATVNAVNPGPVATDMWGRVSDDFLKGLSPFVQTTPLSAIREGVDDDNTVKGAEILKGRPAYDHEIAGVVGMLCGSDSGWCTGSVICANGGFKFST